MMQTAAYWACGGDLIAAPHRRLSVADAQSLRALYQDEACAASNAGDQGALARAQRLRSELDLALASYHGWRRASGPVRV